MKNFKFKISNLKLQTIIILILSGILISLMFFIVLNLKIGKIVCNSQYGPCSTVQNTAFSPFLGERILTISNSDIKKTALSLSGVNEVSSFKHLTGWLEISMELSKPKMAVQLNNKFFLLDERGDLVGQQEETQLPKIIIDNNQILDHNSHLVPVINLIDLLFLAFKLDSATLAENRLLFNIDGVDVLMPANKNPQILVGSLQHILNSSTIEGKRPEMIDLRWKNPVVRF